MCRNFEAKKFSGEFPITDNWQLWGSRYEDDQGDWNETDYGLKYNKKGDIRKKKVITKYNKYRVDKTKYDKEGKVRKEVTRKRKKGGTGIGQAIKDTLARKKKKREERKNKK